MKTAPVFVLASLLSVACSTTGPGISLQNTHADRWRAATQRYESGRAERRASADVPAQDLVPRAVPAPRVLVVPAAPRNRPTYDVYDVNDLVLGRPSFTAPRLGFGGFEDEDAPRVTYEAPIDPETLAEAIRSSIDPGSWEEEGNSVEVVNGRLIVRRRNGD